MSSPKIAVHQPAIDPVLAFQAFGDVDAERVTDGVRAGRSQPGVTGVDRIECGADLLLLQRLHASKSIRTHVRIKFREPRLQQPVDEIATVDNCFNRVA